MGDVTKNISASELFCKCGKCSVRIQDHEPVIHIVQSACDFYSLHYEVDKVRLEITSAARCREHNIAIGSNDESQHIRCSAMDIKIFVKEDQYLGEYQIKPELIFKYLNQEYPGSFGLGDYRTFTHIDTRHERARW